MRLEGARWSAWINVNTDASSLGPAPPFLYTEITVSPYRNVYELLLILELAANCCWLLLNLLVIGVHAHPRPTLFFMIYTFILTLSSSSVHLAHISSVSLSAHYMHIV